MLAIPYAYQYSEVSEVTNIIFDRTLRCLLYHFSKKPLRSVLYHGHRLIDVESILIKQPRVCLAPFFCRMRLDFIIFFCWYLTKNASGLSRTFGTGNWCRSIRAISECNQFSCLWWKIPSINTEYLSQGDTL